MHDVPPTIWQLTLLDETPAEVDPPLDLAGFARLLLDVGRRAIAGEIDADPELVQVWPCLLAGLLEPLTLAQLPEVMTPPDRELLRELAELLPEPGAGVCLILMDDLRAA